MRARRGNEQALVLKFGGSSSTTMEGANPEYFLPFFKEMQDVLTQHYARLALVIGGGPRIRALQAGVEGDREKDTVAIRALREHAQQLGNFARKSGFSVEAEVPQNEEHAREIFARDRASVITIGGLKTGQSTDTAAVTAAEMFRDQGYEALVVILSNVWRIFTADPKTHPEALPIRRASLNTLVREGVLHNDPAQFRPGMNVTIDPVAVHKLQNQNGRGHIPLWFGHGQDQSNLRRYATNTVPENGTSIVDGNLETEYYEEP